MKDSLDNEYYTLTFITVLELHIVIASWHCLNKDASESAQNKIYACLVVHKFS